MQITTKNEWKGNELLPKFESRLTEPGYKCEKNCLTCLHNNSYITLIDFYYCLEEISVKPKFWSKIYCFTDLTTNTAINLKITHLMIDCNEYFWGTVKSRLGEGSHHLFIKYLLNIEIVCSDLGTGQVTNFWS